VQVHITAKYAYTFGVITQKGRCSMYITIGRHKFIAMCLAVICAFSLPFMLPDTEEAAVTAAAKNTDWGLNFQQSGAQPIGNASAEHLSKYDAFYVGKPDEKVIYLTFDAGYENGFTPKILDALKKHNVPAAFFLVGNYIKDNPDLVKRMCAEGHIVGNHTDSHPDMSKISDLPSFTRELQTLESKFKDATGTEMPRYYRPPQGKYNEANLKHACDLGYKTVFWSLAYVDWYVDKQPTKEEAFSKLIDRIHPGAVVLLHSTSETNASILDELLCKWEEMGYSFRSISELCGDD